MEQAQSIKIYDLADRTFKFALNCRKFIKNIKKSITNIDDCKQLIRSSGSVSANYIEANEALSKKDFVHRIKICRKEAKESNMWLRLIEVERKLPQLISAKQELTNEAWELTKIFGAIITKSNK